MIIKIDTDSSAFHNEDYSYELNKELFATEMSRIFNRIVRDLKNGYKCKTILDINGNKIGEWNKEEE